MDEDLKTYSIPVVWQMAGTMKIKARSLAEAETHARGSEPLPTGFYIDDSLELDKDSPFYGEFS